LRAIEVLRLFELEHPLPPVHISKSSRMRLADICQANFLRHQHGMTFDAADDNVDLGFVPWPDRIENDDPT
jgi:hypothetical protein